MNIYVGQIYIEVGINYPFSHSFQKWISEELTRRVQRVRSANRICNPAVDGVTLRA